MLTNDLLSKIYELMPTQKKRIEAAFAVYPKMRGDLQNFLKKYGSYLDRENISLDDLVSSYTQMIQQTILARIDFLRTGRYPASSQRWAYEQVYDNVIVMRQYMLGLALSQFLWRHHYELLQFFRYSIVGIPIRAKILEIGSGHGIYTVEVMERTVEINQLDIVDISDVSLAMTAGIIESVLPAKSNLVHYFKRDITVAGEFPSVKYDWITMGEVLEHVENPHIILKSLHTYLADDGKLFITTCVNSPAIDHVFHFKSVQDIREMVIECGYEINREIIALSESKDITWMEKNKMDISYAAILKKIC